MQARVRGCGGHDRGHRVDTRDDTRCDRQPVASCSDQIDCAGDTRSNAEITGEGQRTGSCPLPRRN